MENCVLLNEASAILLGFGYAIKWHENIGIEVLTAFDGYAASLGYVKPINLTWYPLDQIMPFARSGQNRMDHKFTKIEGSKTSADFIVSARTTEDYPWTEITTFLFKDLISAHAYARELETDTTKRHMAIAVAILKEVGIDVVSVIPKETH